jgi:hypothetical protein
VLGLGQDFALEDVLLGFTPIAGLDAMHTWGPITCLSDCRILTLPSFIPPHR